MVDRTGNRSNSYQHFFAEISCSSEILTSVSDSSGLSSRLNPFHYNEEILELQDKLKVEFWRLVKETLTDRQREILLLTAEGKTQSEIAKKLSINQCHSDDTEFLTSKDGWKKIHDINSDNYKNIEIACFNKETSAIEYHVPEALHKSHYEGKMVHFNTANLDVLVTPNHKMWAKREKEYQLITASEMLVEKDWYKFITYVDIAGIDFEDESRFHTGEAVKEVDYSGVVWCFTVPTGMFVTRRNGKITVHANSSIVKSRKGNTSYDSPNGKRVYGGAEKRLKKLVETDEKIQAILARIKQIRMDEEDM